MSQHLASKDALPYKYHANPFENKSDSCSRLPLYSSGNVFINSILFIVTLCISGCIDSNSNGSASAGDDSPYRLFGINFSPYIDGQSPESGTQIDVTQLTSRMEVMADHTEWIRTYSMLDGLGASGRVAHNLGYKAALGAWIGRDLTRNDVEIETLISAAQAGEADMVIVGSEVLLRRDVTASELVEYINRVQLALPNIPVSYADQHEMLLLHPEVIDAVDVVFVNYYPYWSGVSLENAIKVIDAWHKQVMVASDGKTVYVSESGWPDCGDTIGPAVPSSDNSAQYFISFISWARYESIPYFYFETFDEEWKTESEGPQGACWGVWDRFGNLKPGMEAVFEGKTIPIEVENDIEPGLPSIELTYVPPLGSFENLRGRVNHVLPAAYYVAVYIYVSGWWTKPYFDRPKTMIQADGSWMADITTGGVDQRATRVAAFLLPVGYDEPALARNSATLPAELYNVSIASMEVMRSE
jgi:exo-beta-1,3-glucanase (GH17 family)